MPTGESIAVASLLERMLKTHEELARIVRLQTHHIFSFSIVREISLWQV